MEEIKSKEEQFAGWVKSLPFSDAIKFFNVVTPEDFRLYNAMDKDDAAALIKLYGVNRYLRLANCADANKRTLYREYDKDVWFQDPYEAIMDMDGILMDTIIDADDEEYERIYKMFPEVFKILRSKKREYYIRVHATVTNVIKVEAPGPIAAEKLGREYIKDIAKIDELFPFLRNKEVSLRTERILG